MRTGPPPCIIRLGVGRRHGCPFVGHSRMRSLALLALAGETRRSGSDRCAALSASGVLGGQFQFLVFGLRVLGLEFGSGPLVLSEDFNALRPGLFTRLALENSIGWHRTGLRWGNSTRAQGTGRIGVASENGSQSTVSRFRNSRNSLRGHEIEKTDSRTDSENAPASVTHLLTNSCSGFS